MSRPEIICLGEALVDMMPLIAGTSIISGGELKMAAGGAPANVAVGLARLGCPTGFIGKVGADFFGLYLKSLLTENGVNTEQMLLETRANTGLAFVSWNERHEAEYLFYRNPSADILLESDDISTDYIRSAKLLQFGSLMLASEPSGSATYQALNVAHQAGLILSYDLNLRMNAWKSEEVGRAAVRGPLDFAHIVKVNRAELTFLTGETDMATGCRALWRDHFKLIVVTLDKDGCFYYTNKFSGFAKAFPAKVLDTVGAGDGFLAGLLEGLWSSGFNFDDKAEIEKACRQAAAVGAIVVGRPGGIPAMPTRTEVADFLASHA
jgi:fructokinase